jgi:hypothetical protein
MALHVFNFDIEGRGSRGGVCFEGGSSFKAITYFQLVSIKFLGSFNVKSLAWPALSGLRILF